MHRPYPLAGAAATAATTSTTTTAAGGAAELEWTKRVPITKGTARIQTPTARRWWVAFSLMASHQRATTTSAWPAQEASAHTPTTKTPTHSLKVPIPQSSFYSWEE